MKIRGIPGKCAGIPLILVAVAPIYTKLVKINLKRKAY
jgi:hypothetical protein